MSEQMNNVQTSPTTSPIIKVLGVGGGGSNAVNYMYEEGIVDVEFLICNTDAQAMDKSPVERKIEIGTQLTEGRGAGNNPEVGKKAAEESREAIKTILEKDTKMLFITAGMGGGTGTGAAPVIAQIAKELGILTVGIITIPFQFEGKTRFSQAVNGVEEMEKHVDSLLVVNNEKLRKIHGDLKISDAFSKADSVLAIAAKGIAEIITVHGHVNVDFADVNTVMKGSGVAILGAATAAGDNRSLHAIKKALNSPLLNSNEIKGARNILLNVTSGTEEFRLDELGDITDYVQSQVQNDVQIIWGNGIDESLENKIRIVVIATGFEKKDIHEEFAIQQKIDEKEVVKLDDKPQVRTISNSQHRMHISAPVSSNVASTSTRKEVEVVTLKDDGGLGYNHADEQEFVRKPVVRNDNFVLFDNVEPKKVVQPVVSSKTAEARTQQVQKPVQRKKKIKKTGSVGGWIQTTLDNLFNEEIK